MGAAVIVIWMLVVVPVLIVCTGLAGAMALDFAFERINRPPSGEEDATREVDEA